MDEEALNLLEAVELQDLHGAILFTVNSHYLPSLMLILNYLILRNSLSRMKRQC